MAIRNYNPGRNRRGRISLAAERFLNSSLFLAMVFQGAFLFTNQNEFNFVGIGVLFFGTVFSLAHAKLTFGNRYLFTYLFAVIALASVTEIIGTHSAWPFGEYRYLNMGFEIFKMPIAIPLIWLASIHPILVMVRRISMNWVFLLGSIALTAYDIFLNQFLVSNNRKVWNFSGSHIPFQTHVPMSNLLGWLLVGLTVMGLLNQILPKDRRKIGASMTPIDIWLSWAFLYNFLGNIFFFSRPGTAFIGGLAFAPLLFLYIASRYLGQP